MHQNQEPKYVARNGHIVNRKTGEVIPDDEPLFILRGKDIRALDTLRSYLSMIENPAHRTVVEGRMVDFDAFARAHPERMKEPD